MEIVSLNRIDRCRVQWRRIEKKREKVKKDGDGWNPTQCGEYETRSSFTTLLLKDLTCKGKS